MPTRICKNRDVNPNEWALPLGTIWLILLGIIILRAGGTYVLGRLARSGVIRFPKVHKLLSSAAYKKVERAVDRWGAPFVSLSFFTIGIQTLANLYAGTSRMSLWRYIPALLVGGAGWALVYSTVGFVGFTAVVTVFRLYPVLATAGACIFVIIGIVGLLLYRRPKD